MLIYSVELHFLYHLSCLCISQILYNNFSLSNHVPFVVLPVPVLWLTWCSVIFSRLLKLSKPLVNRPMAFKWTSREPLRYLYLKGKGSCEYLSLVLDTGGFCCICLRTAISEYLQEFVSCRHKMDLHMYKYSIKRSNPQITGSYKQYYKILAKLIKAARWQYFNKKIMNSNKIKTIWMPELQ